MLGPVELIAKARVAGLDLRVEGDRLLVHGPRSAEAIVLQIRDQKPAIMALLAAGNVDVQWRIAAFHAVIPTHGPIWPPRIRTTPLCDTPGYCSLCGDELPLDPAPRFRRCAACVQALWLAMNEIREGVVAEGECSRADAP